ncbi:hypothetical protein SAY86_001482 [Trapa natans]|uniref:WRKY domain-containing protein n=1 Tax=Trapa natans TaxID=22666 RepID=A0AAN7MDK1_TRANT|nr:hypothetical protein SAY86_001482 [Trapa natans]
MLPENLSAAVQQLLRGQDSAKKLRDLLTVVSSVDQKKPHMKEEVDGAGGDRSPPPLAAKDLLGDIFQSLTSTISILNNGSFEEASQVPPGGGGLFSNSVKSEESEESSKCSTARGRRGCYRRRKISDSWTTLSSSLVDDGQQWRKYGQKAILNTSFPRSYFRCTHQLDQGCPAKKQVQMTSENPPVFRTIYTGKHTCRSLLKPSHIILAHPRVPGDTSILLNFETGQSTDNSSNTTTATRARIRGGKTREAREEAIANYVNVSCNNLWSSSSEYEGFPSPDYTLLESAIGSDQGDVLSSNQSLEVNMDLSIDGFDFEEMLAHTFS